MVSVDPWDDQTPQDDPLYVEVPTNDQTLVGKWYKRLTDEFLPRGQRYVELLHEVDGPGSGLDADMVDGRHADEFVLTTIWDRVNLVPGQSNLLGYGERFKLILKNNPRNGNKLVIPFEWEFTLEGGSTTGQVGRLFAHQYGFNAQFNIDYVEYDHLVFSGSSEKILNYLNGTYDSSVLRVVHTRIEPGTDGMSGTVYDIEYADFNDAIEIYVARA